MKIFKAMIPNEVWPKVVEIPIVNLNQLKDKGIRVAFLDYDNTIDIDRSTAPSDYSLDCINYLEMNGFKCCLVSNAKSSRSSVIAKELGLPSVNCAHKPRTDGVKRAMELMNATNNECVMIGDQIFTDVMAGNLAGCYTIMVEKYQPKEIWYVKIKRPFEKIVRLIARF
ncbi:MAG: YqeG family HAD IIIA-type phosphatase [Clostridia bacterium]|nr:YqeG family HAD IIIA-type phosphatase [Clostridia bacterium]